MTTSAPTELRLERTFAAAPERVFDAWTNPEVLRRWWAAAVDGDTPRADVDLRVGGSYRLTMHDPGNDTEFTVMGEFTAIDPPDRIAYTWSWEGAPPADTLVTVEFRRRGRRHARRRHPHRPARRGVARPARARLARRPRQPGPARAELTACS